MDKTDQTQPAEPYEYRKLNTKAKVIGHVELDKPFDGHCPSCGSLVEKHNPIMSDCKYDYKPINVIELEQLKAKIAELKEEITMEMIKCPLCNGDVEPVETGLLFNHQIKIPTHIVFKSNAAELATKELVDKYELICKNNDAKIAELEKEVNQLKAQLIEVHIDDNTRQTRLETQYKLSSDLLERNNELEKENKVKNRALEISCDKYWQLHHSCWHSEEYLFENYKDKISNDIWVYEKQARKEATDDKC